MSKTTSSVSERDFYLAEFRRRSIGFAWPADETPELATLERLIGELVGNQTRVVLMSAREDVLGVEAAHAQIEMRSENYVPRLWRALEASGCASLRLPVAGFEDACLQAALELNLAKVVWIQSTPPVHRSSRAGRISVVDLAHLAPLLDAEMPADASGFSARPEAMGLLEAVQKMIRGGIPSVNVCAPDEIERELLTYAGAGIFFTRDRYAEVRKLGVDDFWSATDLIAKGEADGFLAPRDAASRDIVLANAVGVFIEGRYLAGIGAILPYPEERAVEIASLYALTRYVGEGVGGQIVRYAIERAAREGLAYVFCCTTSERVEAFFERHGFRVVAPEDLPKRKWENYARERLARVRCLRIDP